MTTSEDIQAAVVEQTAGGTAPDMTQRSLDQRVRQQEILADLGVLALQGGAIDPLLSRTVLLVAEGLRSEFCKVLEFAPHDNCFTVRAGVGWDDGVVGIAKVGADLASPAGYALKTGRPVISNHLSNEQRFRTPELFARHGIVRAINVILQGNGAPFGVLEVDSRSDEDFTEKDISFIQGAANILGMAIERERNERLLQEALGHQRILMEEMNHRIKNSLSIVSSMLRLQATNSGSSPAALQLEAAAHRVRAVARAHESLYQSDDVKRLDIGRYLRQVCRDIDQSVDSCEIVVAAEDDILITTDRAIPLALLVNELITNSAKHAYGGRVGGRIWVDVTRDAAGLGVCVRDEGTGLPEGFDFGKTKGLGMRLMNAFVQQLDAEITIRPLTPGTAFTVRLPLDRPA